MKYYKHYSSSPNLFTYKLNNIIGIQRPHRQYTQYTLLILYYVCIIKLLKLRWLINSLIKNKSIFQFKDDLKINIIYKNHKYIEFYNYVTIYIFF